jgi:hypothetical protein
MFSEGIFPVKKLNLLSFSLSCGGTGVRKRDSHQYPRRIMAHRRMIDLLLQVSSLHGEHGKLRGYRG